MKPLKLFFISNALRPSNRKFKTGNRAKYLRRLTQAFKSECITDLRKDENDEQVGRQGSLHDVEAEVVTCYRDKISC